MDPCAWLDCFGFIKRLGTTKNEISRTMELFEKARTFFVRPPLINPAITRHGSIILPPRRLSGNAKAKTRSRHGVPSLLPSLLHTLSMKIDFTLPVNMLLPMDVDQPTFNVNVCDLQ